LRQLLLRGLGRRRSLLERPSGYVTNWHKIIEFRSMFRLDI
jgi:hypothetical protein